MRTIIVVDCQSTSINFIDDIYNRRYNPIVLELIPDIHDDIDGYRQKMDLEYERSDYEFEVIQEKESYEETLEMIRELDPLLVLAGSNDGVFLATKLSYDLDLLGNPIESIDAMSVWEETQKRLAENNLRYIKSKVIFSLGEAIDFYDCEDLQEVVIKQLNNEDEKICFNKQEMIDCIEMFFTESDSPLLLREHIDGEEYIVNTTSSDGIHRITTIWRYDKIRTRDGNYIYDAAESVNDLYIGEAEMIDYAYDVADALRIQYGPVSGEYMIDDNGPVLVNINCCPMSGHLPSEFLNEVSGQHETDSILDSYLKPEYFLKRRSQKYRLNSYGAFKRIVAPKDIIAKSAPMNNLGPRLRSFHESVIDDLLAGEKFYPKTKDSDTGCGLIFLVNKDFHVLQEDIRFLRSVEKNAFDLVLSPEADVNYHFNVDITVKKLKMLVQMSKKYGDGLLISDQILSDVEITQVGLEGVKDVGGQFDFVIVNLNRSFLEKSDYLTIDIIFDIFSFIKVNGFIFIPETTCRYIPGGRKGIEALLKAMQLKIEVPPYGIKQGVIASKEEL